MWVHSGVEFLGPRAKIQLPEGPSSRVPPAAPAPLAGPGALLEASGWSGHQRELVVPRGRSSGAVDFQPISSYH